MNYDIIGDIHGQAHKLTSLLDKLGYTKQQGVYQQEGHQAVFVGDFIDRGTQHKQVIGIVKSMIDAGKALAVMGNHEFNAICYHTLKADSADQYLRKHDEKHFKQHKKFLEEYPLDHPETNELIDWFKTLPLYLELEGKFRVIHACWDKTIIDDIKSKGYLNDVDTLKTEFYPQAVEKGHELYEALEILLKGREVKLPIGQSFQDKDDNTRHEIRIKWWEKDLETYQHASVLPIESLKELNHLSLPDEVKNFGYPSNQIAVFFGHYWFSGEVKPISDNIACLDYSAAKSGPLVAYRWKEQSPLHKRFFLESEDLITSEV